MLNIFEAWSARHSYGPGADAVPVWIQFQHTQLQTAVFEVTVKHQQATPVPLKHIFNVCSWQKKTSLHSASVDTIWRPRTAMGAAGTSKLELTGYHPFVPLFQFPILHITHWKNWLASFQVFSFHLLVTLLASFLQCLPFVTHFSISGVLCTAFSISFFVLALRLPSLASKMVVPDDLMSFPA